MLWEFSESYESSSQRNAYSHQKLIVMIINYDMPGTLPTALHVLFHAIRKAAL